MKCNICKNEASILFNDLVLNKYKVDYFKCSNCGFIQTEKPYWLNEAYGNAITDLDIGLVSRNLIYSDLLEKIIKNNFNYKGKFLDYAGGYGLFVRLMRDKGFDFYWEDKYCKNIFAKNFDVHGLKKKNRFDLITAFELFEHLANPINELKKMLKYSDVIIFSTELQPEKKINNANDWWYFAQETGQHISFYSKETLQYIANNNSLFLYSKENLHVLSKVRLANNPLITDKNNAGIEMTSLIQPDFELAKNITKQTTLIKNDLSDKAENPDRISDLIYKLSLTLSKLEIVTNRLSSAKSDLYLAKDQLTAIYTSREWKLINISQKVAKAIIPNGSLRRKFSVKLWRLSKLSIKSAIRIFRWIRSMFLFGKNYLLKFKPRKKRKINTNSKKIVYVGHSYHNKTKSTAFLIEYLKQFFEVEEILDESWLGKPFPDLSFIDESYLGVIFFQLLPPPKTIKNIKNENILYFPMYDQSGELDYDYWNKYKNLKIVNFSKTLHEKLYAWGLDSTYIQFFPEPNKFIPGNHKEIFFWQRTNDINIKILDKIFANADFKIHIHRATDPGYKFIWPTKDEESRFSISYSDWFNNKEDLNDILAKKGIYIAPRKFEGIGMGFLEAMAMGKAVVSENNPTMNEYIEDCQTGYFFNRKDLGKIDFSNIKEVQKNAHEFIRAGHAKWIKERSKIIDIINR